MTTETKGRRATRLAQTSAAYAVVVGLLIAGFWTTAVLTGGGPELRTAPLEIGYHLVAELSTAVALLAAGTGRLRGRAWAAHVFPVALGMLLYTVVNSAGYDAERGDVAMVGLFSVLTVAALAVPASELARPSGRRAARSRDGATTATDPRDAFD